MATKQVTKQVTLLNRVIAVGWIAEDIAEATGLDIKTVERFLISGTANHDTQTTLERFVDQRAMFCVRTTNHSRAR